MQYHFKANGFRALEFVLHKIPADAGAVRLPGLFSTDLGTPVIYSVHLTIQRI